MNQEETSYTPTRAAASSWQLDAVYLSSNAIFLLWQIEHLRND